MGILKKRLIPTCVPTALAVLFAVSISVPALADERSRFRDFISEIFLCSVEKNSVLGGECIKGVIQREPLTAKWVTDPDHVETLFQASGMDEQGAEVAGKARDFIANQTDRVASRLKKGALQTLVADLLPTLGQYLTLGGSKQLTKVASQLPPQNYQKLHVGLRAAVKKFNVNEIGAFDDFFTSVDGIASGESAKTKELTGLLIGDYFAALTVEEKSRIVSDFFKAPVRGGTTDKLRPLLQNLDPIMQKIFQLFGQMVDSKEIKAAISLLHSSIETFPFEAIKERFEARYGRPFDSVFKDYDISKMKRATTGQVLFATVIETGERVGIKVRIPGILDAYEKAQKRLLGLDVVRNNKAIWKFVIGILETIRAELDYRNEAKFTDLSQSLYSSPKRGIEPLRRIKSFIAEEDIVIYAFASGKSPTSFTEGGELALRAKRIKSLVELWTETVFFKNIESDEAKFFNTTMFHGDLHPGNLLLDTKTEILTILDFGNMGFFPLEERRQYVNLTLAASNYSPDQIVRASAQMYGEKGAPRADVERMNAIAEEVWADPKLRPKRLDHFLSRASNAVDMPLKASISSFTRGRGFLKTEADEIDKLLAEQDPTGKIPRVEFTKTMNKTIVKGIKQELSPTLFGKADDALISRTILKRALSIFWHSRFVNPCLNLFRPKIKAK